MKQHWYKTNLTKMVLIILEHVLVVILVLSFLWLVSYPALREEIFEGNPARKYEDSRGFASQLESKSEQVLNGISASNFFETNGSLDEEKIIDIEEWYKNGEAPGKNVSGLAYRLGDLIEWSNGMTAYDANSSDYMNMENIVVCERPAADGNGKLYQYYTYSDFESAIQNGDLQFAAAVEADAQAGLLQTLQDGYGYQGMESYDDNGEELSKEILNAQGEQEYIDYWNYDGFRVEERFAPIGGGSILDIVNQDAHWNGRLEKAYEELRACVEMIGGQYSEYNAWMSDLQEGDTNYAYIYVDPASQEVYTNREEYQDLGSLETNLETLKDTGKYIIIRPKLADFDTNVAEADASIWRDMVKYSGTNEEDFVFAAAVDTSYPIQDSFYSENRLYEQYGSSAREIALIGLAAGILAIAGGIWLTFAAGRNNKDEELHLCWFDRWKTEIAGAVVVLLWCVPFLFINSGYFWVGDIYSNSYGQTTNLTEDMLPVMIMGAVTAAISCSAFLIGYLSLVRRIKARNLWKNSILRWICSFIYRIFSNLHCLWRRLIMFGGFVLIHWIAILCWPSGFWGILMLAAEGAALVYLVHEAVGREKIKTGIMKISGGEVDYKIPTEELRREQKIIGEQINSIGEGLDAAMEERMKSERLKTDLITNVSHDIKTPLTSIINYVDLLKKENFEDPKIQRYLEILESKAQRLKTLTEDVVEASKVSSGNISLEYMNINFVEMIQQTSGEFEEKFKARNLTEVMNISEEEAYIRADGRRTWRILENIYNNAAKYAMEGTRIYADMKVIDNQVTFSLKNISQQQLNISADELTERFIRGDISRSTEGSGLGLSIAKTLTEMQGGKFELYLDGDLFKVTIVFPRV